MLLTPNALIATVHSNVLADLVTQVRQLLAYFVGKAFFQLDLSA